MSVPGKILVVRLSSLGDILHALPAFRSLRSAFPEAILDWVVEERFRHMLSVVSGIDRVLVLNTKALRQAPWRALAWKRNLQVVRTMRRSSYDIAIDFQGLIKTGLLTALSGAPTRIGFSGDLARESWASLFYNLKLSKPAKQLHIVEQNQQLACLAGAPAVIPSPVEFVVRPSDANEVDSLLSKAGIGDFVVINPGGGWYTKRWDPVKYGRLARRIRTESDLDVVVTTGPGEEPLYEEILRNSGDRPPFHMRVPFLRLIPLFRRARLVIGGDTGPFHLACAVGTPVVGIFGPTSPARNGPWTSSEECVARILPCSYCNGRTCPTDNECMAIPVDDVYEAVTRRLRKEVDKATQDKGGCGGR